MVPVVVDFGGASDTGEVACVPVAPGSDDAQVLVARAKMLHVPAPRYNESGLLCAIDGYPATGCGQVTGTHYAYWAYYHGGTAWTYASVGPASWQVFPGDVEGWRFEPDGSASPADPPPRAPSDAPTLCPSSSGSTTTTTTAPTTTPPSTVPPGPGSPPSGGGSGPQSSPAGSQGPAPSADVPGAARATAPGPASRPAPTARPNGTTPGTVSPPAASVRGTHPVALGGNPPQRGGPSGRGGGSGGLIGILIGVGLIALFAVGAMVRGRRTARTG